MSDQAILEIVERLKNRFYGKYRGIVTEVEGAGGRGRIKAKVPAVLGDTPTGWCSPCVPYAGPGVGLALMPEVGSGVWIEFEAGDVSYPIWSGCYWRDGELPADAPAKKVLRTKAGHQIAFDDDGQSITITDASENSVVLEAAGITLKRGKSVVKIDDAKMTVNDGALEVTS